MSHQSFEDYYEFLGVSMHASDQELSSAFQSVRQMYSSENTDIHNYFSQPEIMHLQRLIDEAYSILYNPLKRATYNEVLKKRLPEKYGSIPLPRKEFDPQFKNQILQKDKFDGLFLKQIRQHLEYSQSELSGITRIKGCYIEALENNDFENLPAPVFVRGFIAQISKVFGLDDQKICQSYMSFYNEAREND